MLAFFGWGGGGGGGGRGGGGGGGGGGDAATPDFYGKHTTLPHGAVVTLKRNHRGADVELEVSATVTAADRGPLQALVYDAYGVTHLDAIVDAADVAPLQSLVSGFDGVTHLVAVDTRFVDAAALRGVLEVAATPALRSVVVRRCSVGDAVVHRHHNSATLMAELAATLPPSVTELTVEECGVTDAGFLFLSARIAAGGLPNLERLDLGDNSMANAGFAALHAALAAGRNAQRLRVLDVHGNAVRGVPAAPVAATIMRSAPRMEVAFFGGQTFTGAGALVHRAIADVTENRRHQARVLALIPGSGRGPATGLARFHGGARVWARGDGDNALMTRVYAMLARFAEEGA